MKPLNIKQASSSSVIKAQLNATLGHRNTTVFIVWDNEYCRICEYKNTCSCLTHFLAILSSIRIFQIRNKRWVCSLLLDIDLFFTIIFERPIYEGFRKLHRQNLLMALNVYVLFHYLFANNTEKIKLRDSFIFTE